MRDLQDTRCTGYPHYFDDVLEARSGVMGQYWQRIREIYLSAYLRTMSYAVSEWQMPQKLAAGYCVDIVHGLAGLFEVEPTARPEWLSDFPEQFCAPGADFATLTGGLLHAARAEGMRLVSLSTPIASSVQKYGRLALSSHFVTADYKLPNDALLYEKVLLMPILETFELKGSPEDVTINEARMQGASGDQIAVCGSLYPIPVGAWHGDYFSMGISIPAPCSVPKLEVRCGNASIECVAASGEGVSTTWMWNDDWVPPFPRGSTTRCGTATMIDDEVLAEAADRLERKLAFFVQVRTWDREGDDQDYSESLRTCYWPDQP